MGDGTDCDRGLGRAGRWRLALMLLAIGGGSFYGADRIMRHAESRRGQWIDGTWIPQFHFEYEDGVLTFRDFGGWSFPYPSNNFIYLADLESDLSWTGPPGFRWMWGETVSRETCSITREFFSDSFSAGETVPQELRDMVIETVRKQYNGIIRELVDPDDAYTERLFEACESAVVTDLPTTIGPGFTTREPGLDYRLNAWAMPAVSTLSVLGFGTSGAGLLTGIAWLFGALRRRAWRIRQGLCAACGYDARGLGRCPECGVVSVGSR